MIEFRKYSKLPVEENNLRSSFIDKLEICNESNKSFQEKS